MGGGRRAGGGVRGGVEEVVVRAVVLEVVVLEDLDVLGVGDRDARQVLRTEGGLMRGRQTDLRGELRAEELRDPSCARARGGTRRATPARSMWAALGWGCVIKN